MIRKLRKKNYFYFLLWFLGIWRLLFYDELFRVQLTHRQINFEENDDEFCQFHFSKWNLVRLHWVQYTRTVPYNTGNKSLHFIVKSFANSWFISNIQILLLPSCLATGPKIELCNVTISSRVDDLLKVEYQDWFQNFLHFWTRTLDKWIQLYIDHKINLMMKLNKGVHRQIAFQQSGDVSQVISPINQR